ncbi:gliding motility-associated C-terminal domain-containing protein [Fluviicola sp.]|uniref:T9SS type B sorting domain-containing protein n=1 Tax=Fluviicola sp. TaxID=1917219 RepID=UPI0031D8513A
MKKGLLLLALTSLLLSIAKPAFSQNDEKSTLIGNPGIREFGVAICADNSGYKYIGGESGQKGLIVKQNALNVIQWSKTLTFTSDPNDWVSMGFLDVVGDTVFGCGKIADNANAIGKGSFYFKMNAQTGAVYWSRYEASGPNYLSCMRYSNGKFFLVGGGYGASTNYGGRVLAVSSQTGQVLWQTNSLQGVFTTPGGYSRTLFVSATEMINGKMYITGSVHNFNISMERPFLLGITENGTIFLQKYIDLPVAQWTLDEYIGQRIEYDQDQNLILIVSDNITNVTMDPFFVKCDTSGNLIFAKRYGLPGNNLKVLTALNETATHYVLYGFNITGGQHLYAVKVSKNGVFDKCVAISKPNVYYYVPFGLDFLMGNSTFLNGLHYFVTAESASTVFDMNINQIILDEDLNIVGDCSETLELPYLETNVPASMVQLSISAAPFPLTYTNGITIQDEPFQDPCTTVSLNLVQNTGCQVSVTAATVGFTDPTFYWSNGTSGTSDTLAVSTSDTIIVRVLDTKCCELIDTIVPSITSSSFVMNLPNDTTVCLQPGSSFTINPVFSGANGAITYLWNNASTGSSLNVTQAGTYWVDVSDGCVTLRDSITIGINFLPLIGDTADVEVCTGNFPILLNPTVSAGATVLWDDGTNTASRSVNGPGNYTISATNSCGTVNAIISVTQINLPDVQVIPSIDTCIQNGGNIVLAPIFSDVTTILWQDGSSGNQLTVSTSGNYTVYASNSCGTDSASCFVIIHYFPELFLPATLDTCFDIGVGFSYTAAGSPGFYQWSSGSQTASEWISQEGTYSVTLTNQCRSVTDSMQVRRFTEVDLYFPEDSVKVCEKQLSVSVLQIETNYSLEIFEPDGDPAGTYLNESGWYLVHAFNPCGERWDSIYVNLQNEQFFYLPNSFTPNNDGHNDRFEFKGENITVREIRIFNRWGEEIFTETGAFKGWDGMYRGEICPDGIYAIHAIYEDCFGLPTEFNGHVNLIR